MGGPFNEIGKYSHAKLISLIQEHGGGGGGGTALTVEETDGTPTVDNVSKIKVTTGTLNDNGSGVVTIDTGSPNVVWNGGYSGSSELGGEDRVFFKYGTGTTVVRKLYYLNTSGAWAEADATDTNKGSDALLAIAAGTSPTSDGMMTRGILAIPNSDGLTNGTPQIGKVVYVGETAGEYTFTRPSSSGDYIRVVGWCIDVSGSDILLWFEPSTVWLELS